MANKSKKDFDYYFQTTKIVRDLVHGYINLTPFEINLIDNESFQRLKDIRQLTCHHVYPEARHTRFEHSLGVLELTRKAINHLNINGNIFEKDNEIVISYKIKFNACIAALFHDVGHCPFSHMGESEFDKEEVRLELVEAIKDINSKTEHKIEEELLGKIDKENAKNVGSVHEQLSCIVIMKKFYYDLNSVNIQVDDEQVFADFELIIRCILGIEYEVKIPEDYNKYKVHNAIVRLINSSIFDMDKLDYIMRDSYFTGIGTPKIDTKRLFRNMYFDNSYNIIFTSKAVPALQNMIDARDGLYMYVYNHHAVVYSDFINTYIVRKITHTTNLYLDTIKNSNSEQNVEDYYDYKMLKPINFVTKNYLFSINAILKYYRSDSDWISLLNSINSCYYDLNNTVRETILSQKINEEDAKDLYYRMSTTIKLVHQLKSRQFLKAWWKTVFEFSNFMIKNFPDDNIRKKLGKYICDGGELKEPYHLDASEFRSQIAKHVSFITKAVYETDNSPLLGYLSEGEFFIVQRSNRFFAYDTIEKLGVYLKASEITGALKKENYIDQDHYVKSLTRIIPQKDYKSLYAKEGFYIFTAPLDKYLELKQDVNIYDDKLRQKHYKCIESIFVYVATKFITDGEQVFVNKFQITDENCSADELKCELRIIEEKSKTEMAEEFIKMFLK